MFEPTHYHVPEIGGGRKHSIFATGINFEDSVQRAKFEECAAMNVSQLMNLAFWAGMKDLFRVRMTGDKLPSPSSDLYHRSRLNNATVLVETNHGVVQTTLRSISTVLYKAGRGIFAKFRLMLNCDLIPGEPWCVEAIYPLVPCDIAIRETNRRAEGDDGNPGIGRDNAIVVYVTRSGDRLLCGRSNPMSGDDYCFCTATIYPIPDDD